MVDYTIDDDRWNEKKEEIGAWFDANPDYESKRQLVEMLFSLGDVEIGMRKRHWGSITSVFATVPNSPIQKGRKSIMEGKVLATFKGYLNSFYAELVEIYEGSAYLQATERMHGKSGGHLYSTQEDPSAAYAEDGTKKVRTRLNAAYNAFRANDGTKEQWNGELVDGQPIFIEPTTTEEEE